MADVVIVTGAASGLGAVIASTLCGADNHIVVADRDAEAADELVGDLERGGGRATFVQTDLAEAEQVRSMVGQASALGLVRILVNNAGGWLPGPQFPDSSDWRRALDLNLAMPMLATQLCLPLMTSGGAVVNVSSCGGSDSGPYRSPEYGAAKAGLIRFTTAVADFADRFQVRVSCVVPHWIGLGRAVREYEALSPAEREASCGLVDPQVVADTVLDLVRDPSSAGRVVMLRAGRAPYAYDPAAGDPYAAPE